MTATTAPAPYIAPDTYAGRHVASSLKAGLRPVELTAGEIAAEAAEGVVWESFGTPHGHTREHFARARYVAAPNGDLHIYNSEGGKTLVHPAGRTLRVLRRFA